MKPYKRAIAVFFILSFGLSLFRCGVTYSREEEDNDTPDSANIVYSGKGVRGSIEGENDLDFYRISVKEKLSDDILVHIAVTETVKMDLMIKIYRGMRVVKIVNDSREDTGTAGMGEEIVNIEFSVEDVINGWALFSIENASKSSVPLVEPENRYNLTVKARKKQENEEGEPNDKMVFATNFGSNTIMRGYFNPGMNPMNTTDENPQEEDWYSFSVSHEEFQVFHVSHSAVPDVDTVLSVYDELGYLIREANSYGLGKPEKLMNLKLRRGTYFINLRSTEQVQQNSKVGYLLKIDKEESKNSELEPNDRYPSANVLAFFQDTHGYFNPSGDVDWYRLNIYESQKHVISIRISPTADIDPVVELYTSSGEPILSVDDRGLDEGEIVKNFGVQAGVYLIKVSNRDSTIDNPNNSYTLVAEKAAWKEDQEFELNNSFETGNAFLIGGIIEGYITPRGDRDFYTFQIDTPRKLFVEVSPSILLDLAINIYDNNGELRYSINDNSVEEGEKESFTFSEGVYHVEIVAMNNNENSRDPYFFRIYE